MKQTGGEDGRLFPLPLTSMERFHLLDDGPAFSNSTFAKFEFEGQIDPQLGQQALDMAIARHPLVQAKIDSSGRRPVWVSMPGFRLAVDWGRTGSSYGASRIFDIYREPGVHMYVGSNSDSTYILFHGHHATCDGIGGVQFTTDWLRIYDNLVHHREPLEGLPQLDPSMLVRRNHLGMLRKRYLVHLWKQPIGLFGAFKFIFRKIRPLYPGSELSDAWDENTQPAIIGEWVDPEVTGALRQRAQEQGVAFNALMMSQFFLCLRDWSVDELGQSGEDWIRLIVPMSIRDIADRRQTAMNRATIVQIDRRKRDFENPAGWLSWLDREIYIIREWQLSKIFILAIGVMSKLPGMLARSADSRKCRGTAVYTNLSEPVGRLGFTQRDGSVEVGNMLMKSFDYVGPVRQGTPIYLAIQKHLDRIRVSLHYDPRVIVTSQAEKLLASYVQRLQQVARQLTS